MKSIRRLLLRLLLVNLGTSFCVAIAHGEAKTRVYTVGHFSDEFYATLTVEKGNDVFRPGAVAVYEHGSRKLVLRVESEALTVDLDRSNQASANVKELPYGRQSVLIHEDFDFDGRADLAIMDGQKSCYNGPSFQIFLRRGRGFVKSREFTRLAQEYCGMFQVDAKAKRLSTMTKSGCCWHLFESYDVVNHAPRLLESATESLADYSSYYLKRETTKHGQPTKVEYFLLGPQDLRAKALLEFDLVGPRQRRVKVFLLEGRLEYALVNGTEQRVEFGYELHVQLQGDAERPPFVWSPTSRELSFRNGGYRYVIQDSPGRLGVSVHTGTKVTFLPGVESSRSGSLDRLNVKGLQNVVLAPNSSR